VTTVLFYLVIAAVIGLVVFFLAVFVFGRGEQMAPLDPRTSPAELPEADITSDDVGKVRFALALRGYRMSDVDWTLERLGEQLDVLHRENAALRATASDGSADERVSVGAAVGWQIGGQATPIEAGPQATVGAGDSR
jgi:DivIVA domain-containing protein